MCQPYLPPVLLQLPILIVVYDYDLSIAALRFHILLAIRGNSLRPLSTQAPYEPLLTNKKPFNLRQSTLSINVYLRFSYTLY